MNLEHASYLKAFWSKGRKEFVPLTAEEFERRAGIDEATRFKLSLRKLVKSTEITRSHESVRIYEISKRGIEELSYLEVDDK